MRLTSRMSLTWQTVTSEPKRALTMIKPWWNPKSYVASFHHQPGRFLVGGVSNARGAHSAYSAFRNYAV